MDNQQALVIRHINKYGSITSQVAFKRYGITRLSDVIYKLRRKGNHIETVPKRVKTRQGKHTTVAVYKNGGQV